MARPVTLSTRLSVSAAVLSLVVLLAAGVILSEIHRRATERAFDDRLNIYLHALANAIASPDETDRKDPFALGDPRFEMPMSGWYWQVDELSGETADVRTSGSLFGMRLPGLTSPPAARLDQSVVKGYLTGPDDRRLREAQRVVQTSEGQHFRVRVAGDADEIEASISAFRMPLATTLLLLGALLVGTTGFQVAFGLRPLKILSQAVADVRRGTADRIGGRYPPDLAPLAAELDLLLDANRDILDRARTQVGNLAHALKTPLSVILNEAAAEPGPLADKVREQALVMRDQVNWYLERARAAARAGAVGVSTELEPVAAGLQRVFAKLWSRSGISFDLDVPSGLRFRGEKQDLEEMLGNLVDNAGKWAVSRVVVAARSSGGPETPMLEITVEDDGPGLPEERRTEALARGARLDESRPGQGLGLSIVADLARSHRGELRLETADLGGLRARLRLPAV
jgi:signal transduction histidine kinase